MVQRIIIEGDVVKVVEETISAQTPISDFIAGLASPDVWWGPLPRNTAFVLQTSDTTNIIVEIAPGPRTLMIRDIPANVSMPWQYWILPITHTDRPTGIQLYWRPERLKEPTDPVWVPALPNIGNGGWMCLGSMDGGRRTANTGPRSWDDVTAFIERYYLTRSNSDLGWNIPSPFRTFSQWAKATERDPLVGCRLDMFNTPGRTSILAPGTAQSIVRVDANAFIDIAAHRGTAPPPLLYPDLSTELLEEARNLLTLELNTRLYLKEHPEAAPAQPTPTTHPTPILYTIDRALYADAGNLTPENGFRLNACNCPKCATCNNEPVGTTAYCQTCTDRHAYEDCECQCRCNTRVETMFHTTCDSCTDGSHRNATSKQCVSCLTWRPTADLVTVDWYSHNDQQEPYDYAFCQPCIEATNPFVCNTCGHRVRPPSRWTDRERCPRCARS